MLAVTLSRRDLKEFDQVISFYTKDLGKIEAFARGIKKITAKNAPSLEPFSVLEIELVPGKEKTYITKAYPVELFSRIREGLEKIFVGNYILQVVDASLGPGVKDEKIFEMIHSFLRFLDAEHKPSFLLLPAFIIKFWGQMGFQPVLDKCAKCGGKDRSISFFDISAGGALCKNCAANSVGKKKVGHRLIFNLEFVLKKSWKDIQNLEITSVEKVRLYALIKEYVEYHSGIKIQRQSSLFKKLFFSSI